MAFASFAEFLAMGGHAPYVWSAWGITGFLLVVIVWHARAEHRQLLKGVKRRVRRERVRPAQNQDSTHASQAPLKAAQLNLAKGEVRDDTQT